MVLEKFVEICGNICWKCRSWRIETWFLKQDDTKIDTKPCNVQFFLPHHMKISLLVKLDVQMVLEKPVEICRNYCGNFVENVGCEELKTLFLKQDQRKNAVADFKKGLFLKTVWTWTAKVKTKSFSNWRFNDFCGFSPNMYILQYVLNSMVFGRHIQLTSPCFIRHKLFFHPVWLRCADGVGETCWNL